MKHFCFTLLLTIAFVCIYGQEDEVKDDIKFVELVYGLSDAKILSRQKMDNSPSSNLLTTEKSPHFKERTDSIPAVLGSQFAVVYILKSELSKSVQVNIVWTFPEGMKDHEGNTIKETAFTTQELTNVVTYANYTLEESNEVVKGKWSFKLYIANQLLHERNFYLY